MGKIHERYIDEAVRIRKDYLNNIKNIQEKENIIVGYKDKIEKTMVNIEQYITADVSEQVKSELNNELINMEKDIRKINEELEPFKIKIEQLQKDSSTLFNTIVEAYPDLTVVEIQKEIFSKIPQ